MILPIPPNQIKKKLIEDNLITTEKFDAFFEEAQRKNQNLIDILISEHIVDANYIYNFLASYLGVDLAQLNVRHINEEVVKSLPENIAREKQIIVFDKEEDGTVDVAMLNPSDLATIEFLKQKFNAPIRPFLASTDDLNRGFSIYGLSSTKDFKKIIEESIEESLRSQKKTAEEAAADLPIVAIVDNIISYASSLRASDIHIEILEDVTMVRYRIDGILYEIMRIPKAIHNAIVARIKVLAGLKIDEHMRPQDGRFRYKSANQLIDVRVSIMPTFYGEKAEMRLLEATQKPLSLEEVGLMNHNLKVVEDNLKKTYGMILVCGPTGSGKTTTLYALMNILNKPNINICTIEDPIEYNMRYVNQSQINPEAGITFASGLRALLRQDPNIIMVGEIRDSETAEIAVQAALTGHLILSSLHTNDAPTAIPRLIDLKIPNYLVSSVLNLVIAQRLVRRICSGCIYSYDLTESEKNIIIDQFKEIGILNPEQKIPRLAFRGKGCDMCNGSGYRGRIGIFETFENTDNVKKIISSDNFSTSLLWEEARNQGSETMFEDGLKKVALGITTIDEVLRVIRE
ncbi:MAG: GspE/PulE family protein [Patescibacteria group bacterium]|nr:GspE/PulE family protein [Patescibacteria group bacterium]MDW8279881.1 GspE/PulE family protein [bacterium]